MEFITNLIIDWLLFSLLEAYIFCLFFEFIGKFKRFNKYEVFIVSVLNCVTSKVIPPVLYQLVVLVYLTIYSYIKNNKNIELKQVAIIVLKSLIFFLIIETVYVGIVETFTNVEFVRLNSGSLFLWLLPAKVLEIIIVCFGGELYENLVGWH